MFVVGLVCVTSGFVSMILSRGVLGGVWLGSGLCVVGKGDGGGLGWEFWKVKDGELLIKVSIVCCKVICGF